MQAREPCSTGCLSVDISTLARSLFGRTGMCSNRQCAHPFLASWLGEAFLPAACCKGRVCSPLTSGLGEAFLPAACCKGRVCSPLTSGASGGKNLACPTRSLAGVAGVLDGYAARPSTAAWIHMLDSMAAGFAFQQLAVLLARRSLLGRPV